MASRQEEKERRRAQRIAEEEKARAATRRARRLQMIGGGVLVAAIVVVAAVLISSNGSRSSGDTSPTAATGTRVPIPKPGPLASADKLPQAASAAGCVVKTFPDEGNTHVTTTVNYKTNPPTSGNHNPTPAQDGIYAPGNTPTKEHFVHTLEHGRIEIQYRPGTPKHTRDQLETLFNEPMHGLPGYKMLLFQNNTNMPYAVAATAWTHLLGYPRMNAKVFDAIRAFRAAYTDKAPESQIPPN